MPSCSPESGVISVVLKRPLVHGIALGILAACAPPALAQDAGSYPSRAITLIVPYTSGTGADILSRVLGPRLAERWRVPVVTDNRVGGSGGIGADHVAKALPDGHTLLFTATSFGTTPALSASLPFDPIGSFSPVILLATGALCVVVNPGVPAKSMREFVDLVKKNPGKLNYSSPGNGVPQHLAMELLKLEAGLDIVHIPYNSSSRAVIDLVAGQVQASVAALQTVGPQVNAGKLRMIGVMSAERARAFPDVPTLKEQGMPNLEVLTWYGVLAPAGTPPAVVAKINAELNANLKQATVRDVLAKQGLDPAGGPPEHLGELVKNEIPRWKRVVGAAGIKPD
jgi:tripartite-type tricarboxylate transporter receptor subunit TctC